LPATNVPLHDAGDDAEVTASWSYEPNDQRLLELLKLLFERDDVGPRQDVAS
jgi:predicted AlkP superfamily pyrophosphatase or phosphodiesterase